MTDWTRPGRPDVAAGNVVRGQCFECASPRIHHANQVMVMHHCTSLEASGENELSLPAASYAVTAK